MIRLSISRLFPRAKTDAFILQAPSLVTASTLALLLCCGYAFCVLALNVGSTGQLGLSIEAVSWVATLAVFYGVFLETRPLLAGKFQLPTPSTKAEIAYVDSDERHGMGMLCVGLLSEALTGFPGLHTKWPWAYVVLAIFSLLAVAVIGLSHLRRHWIVRHETKPAMVPPPTHP